MKNINVNCGKHCDNFTLIDDDDVVVSGWGDVDDMREDLLKDWGELLEKWDGREKTRPSKLVNLCRKVIILVKVSLVQW